VVNLDGKPKKIKYKEGLVAEIEKELKKIRPIQCQGTIFEAFKAERSTALRLTHKIMKAKDKPFSTVSKEIWQQIREQHGTCDLPQRQIKEPVEEEQNDDAAIDESSEVPLSTAKEPLQEELTEEKQMGV